MMSRLSRLLKTDPDAPFAVPRFKTIKGDEHIVRDWDLSYDLLATEEFMNNMIAHGYKPVWVSGARSYAFVPCEPGEYVCRTVSSISPNGFFDRKKAAELTEQLQSEGATVIDQRRTLGSQLGLIAIKPTAAGPFELMSDADARIAEYEARKKSNQRSALVFYLIAIMYAILSLTSETFRPLIGLPAVWIVLGLMYQRPVKRYKEAIERLRSEQDSSVDLLATEAVSEVEGDGTAPDADLEEDLDDDLELDFSHHR